MPLLPTRSPRRHRWPPDERDDQRTLAAARHARQCLALRHHPSTRSILVLSAGGPWGAYGAGLIAGWSGARAGPRQRDLIDRRGLSRGELAGSFAGTRPLEARVRYTLAPGRMRAVHEFVENHFTQPIALADLASARACERLAA